MHERKNESSYVSGSSMQMTRRARFVQTVVYISLGAFSTFLLGYILAWRLFAAFPVDLIWVDVGAIVLMLPPALFLRREKQDLAVVWYLIAVTLILFVAMHYIRGVTGPMALALPVVSLIAGGMVGRRGAVLTVIAHSILYITILILEVLEIWPPYPMPQPLMPFLWAGIFVTASVILVAANEQFVSFMQQSFRALEQQSSELRIATQRAEAAVQAERKLRQQDIDAAQQLDITLRQYEQFLEQVMAGDYETRLDLETLAEHRNLPVEILNLGRYLNTTVESLVEALSEVRAVQQAYVQQSWQALAEAGSAPSSFRYHDEILEPSADAWLASMAEAVRSRNMSEHAGELAVSLDTRGEVIGALGLRREDKASWNAEELDILRTVADQLAQTVENLRLLDATNRRAAREQAVAEVTARIRAEVEIESVLELALAELGKALSAERGTAHLMLRQQEGEDV